MTKLGWTIDDDTFVFYLISKMSIGGRARNPARELD